MEKRPRRLGERLIDLGYLTPEQLRVALEEQKRVHAPFGKIVCDLGFVTQAELAHVLAEEAGVPLVHLADENVLPEALRLVSASEARRRHVFPLRIEGGFLKIAVADPSDIRLVDELSQATGYPLRVVASSEAEILEAIRRYYEDTDRDRLSALVDASARSLDKGAPAEDGTVARVVDSLLRSAIEKGATDLHIEPEEKLIRTRFRVDGFLQQGENLPVTIGPALTSRLKILAQLNIAEMRRPQDGRLRYPLENHTVDLRISTMPTTYGENIVVRVLDSRARLPKLGDLGMSPALEQAMQEIADLPHGMFLVTGPTGSGKTTTLYATIGLIDALTTKITTIEDPVECQIPMVRQSQVDLGVGYTMVAGLRAMLRQDPDVILVGEVRDRESADVALRAAITGHLVLSSLHTNTAAGAFPRLLDLGLEPYLVQSAVVAALAQRLVRKVCPSCIEEYLPEESELLALGFTESLPSRLRRGRGCSRCGGTGYSGRTGIFELLRVDAEIGRLVGRCSSEGEIAAASSAAGATTLFDDARQKVLAGITTPMEILRVLGSAVGAGR
ncbi:MAG: GspE/PulE family protein [Planctomycetota bacterium]